MTLRAVIADDEPLARALIRAYLQSHANVKVIAEANQGLDAADKILNLAPDLVFLDIQMPRLSGLDVLQLTGMRRGVIFTTAYDEYALAAFDLHAVDYLLKPFSQERFDAALQRAVQLQEPSGIERLVAGRSLQRVLIRTGAQTHVLALDEVDYVEAQADYVSFHAGDKEYLKAQRISELEGELDTHQFVRVHRSYIVNLAALQAVERTDSDGHAVRLRSGKRLPVSRAGYERLRGAL